MSTIDLDICTIDFRLMRLEIHKPIHITDLCDKIDYQMTPLLEYGLDEYPIFTRDYEEYIVAKGWLIINRHLIDLSPKVVTYRYSLKQVD